MPPYYTLYALESVSHSRLLRRAATAAPANVYMIDKNFFHLHTRDTMTTSAHACGHVLYVGGSGVYEGFNRPAKRSSEDFSEKSSGRVRRVWGEGESLYCATFKADTTRERGARISAMRGRRRVVGEEKDDDGRERDLTCKCAIVSGGSSRAVVVV